DVPELGRKLAVGRETRWPATISVGSRVLAGLAIRGTAVRTRPVGTWRSSRHLWGFLPAWLGVPAPAADPPTAHRRRARAALAGRYVARFGPVTEEDVAWWTGWGLGDTRMALADAAVERVMVDGPAGAAEAYVAAADLEEATAQRGVDPGD